MTFCCWPSAVMSPAGSGFADVGEKVDFNETELQTYKVDVNPCALLKCTTLNHLTHTYTARPDRHIHLE